MLEIAEPDEVAVDLDPGTLQRGPVTVDARLAAQQFFAAADDPDPPVPERQQMLAHQLDPTLPNPPKGSLADGPNSSIQDPLAQEKLTGCTGQFCYLDHIDSWSTNELTINWNSTLAWVASALAGLKDARCG